MQLIDTVKVGLDKGICLTDVVKSPKDILLYFRDEDIEVEAKPVKKSAPKANGYPSPMKNKMLKLPPISYFST